MCTCISPTWFCAPVLSFYVYLLFLHCTCIGLFPYSSYSSLPLSLFPLARLSASDVMSTTLSYIHPITRVRSIITLLESTTFSAFPVVTPILELPKVYDNNAFIPRLYDPNWKLLELDGQSTCNARQRDSHHSVSPINERTSLLGSSSIVHNYSLTFEKSQGKENGNLVQVTSKKPIALRGIILRSQLITLLKRKVFFDENNKVLVHVRVHIYNMVHSQPANITFNEHELYCMNICITVLGYNKIIHVINYSAAVLNMFHIHVGVTCIIGRLIQLHVHVVAVKII